MANFSSTLLGSHTEIHRESMLQTHRRCREKKTNKHRKRTKKNQNTESMHACNLYRSGCGGNRQPYARFILTHTTTSATTATMTHRNEPFLLLCLRGRLRFSLCHVLVCMLLLWLCCAHACFFHFSLSRARSLVRWFAGSLPFSFVSALYRSLVVYFSTGEH